MSQKSNLLTIRFPNKSLDLDIQHPKEYLQAYKLTNILKQSLEKKGIILISSVIKANKTNYFLKLELFLGTSKLAKYKTLFRQNKNYTSKNKFLNKLIAATLSYKSLTVNTTVLNHFLDYNQTKRYFTIFKKFKNILFARQFALFIDFIKLTSLFIVRKIPIKSYLQLLGKIFKTLPKNKHSRYLAFINQLFNIIVIDPKNSITGLKLEINGKLKGKLRSSSEQINEGNISNPSISKVIDYSMIHVYTIYGSFGMKFWVSYST